MSEHSDPEKNLSLKEAGGSNSATASPMRAEYEDGPRQSWMRRFIDSFKRDPSASVTKAGASAVSRGHFDHKTAAENTANSGLAQKLQSRHMQMIAIGGSIGTLFRFAFLGYMFNFYLITRFHKNANSSQELVSSLHLARLSPLVVLPPWLLRSASSASSCSAPCRPLVS